MLSLLQYQKSKGYAAGTDIAAQQAQLAQLEATLPPLLKQRDQQNNLIAVLTGRYPGASCPAEVHAREPDASGRAAAQPALGTGRAAARRPSGRGESARGKRADRRCTANRLPNITLTANAGSNALAIGQLFGPGTGFWNIGAALLAPIFDGGTLLHQQRGARAAYQQSRRAISKHSADRVPECRRHARRRSSRMPKTLKSTAAAADAAKASLDLARLQYKDGYAAYLAVLNAEQAYQQARLSLVQAKPTASPTRPHCSRRWAAAGGTAPNSTSTANAR